MTWQGWVVLTCPAWGFALPILMALCASDRWWAREIDDRVDRYRSWIRSHAPDWLYRKPIERSWNKRLNNYLYERWFEGANIGAGILWMSSEARSAIAEGHGLAWAGFLMFNSDVGTIPIHLAPWEGKRWVFVEHPNFPELCHTEERGVFDIKPGQIIWERP